MVRRKASEIRGVADHHTPPELALELAENTLAPWINSGDRRMRVLDPACGHGALLLACRKAAARRGCVVDLYGWDIDQPSADECRRRIPDADIRCGDWLTDGDSQAVDAIIMNPPFLGGLKISTTLGPDYLARLRRRYPGTGGTADLASYFLRRADEVLRRGTIGVLGTNTLAQGDTRRNGLRRWLWDDATGSPRTDLCIYRSDPGRSWPGNAAVTFVTIYAAKGFS